MEAYFNGVWKARYFWSHLALSDLRSKWRRSFMGLLWSVMQPLGLTLLLALVFSRLFHTDIVAYAPYIFSGIITWEFVSASILGGSLAFVQADAYIKQCKHPLFIYILRLTLGHLITLALASTGLLIWAAWALPHHVNASWFALITFFPVIALMICPLTSLFAYLGVRFRDIPHAMGLVLQAIWFISPVYFEEKMFRSGGLSGLVDYNPLYHLLQIIRAPLLTGTWPSIHNYLFCIGTAVGFIVLTLVVGSRMESKVIFYL
jgi:lipopolysaccharide transport system permease protein